MLNVQIRIEFSYKIPVLGIHFLYKMNWPFQHYEIMLSFSGRLLGHGVSGGKKQSSFLITLLTFMSKKVVFAQSTPLTSKSCAKLEHDFIMFNSWIILFPTCTVSLFHIHPLHHQRSCVQLYIPCFIVYGLLMECVQKDTFLCCCRDSSFCT